VAATVDEYVLAHTTDAASADCSGTTTSGLLCTNMDFQLRSKWSANTRSAG